MVSYLPSPTATNSEDAQGSPPTASNASSASSQTCTSQPGKVCPGKTKLQPKPTPCKVISYLASNPNADITQMPISEDEPQEANEPGGVQCSKAYRMLMQFATTDEKLETISHALESGCVKNSSGGCKVRNEVLWKALDDVQQD